MGIRFTHASYVIEISYLIRDYRTILRPCFLFFRFVPTSTVRAKRKHILYRGPQLHTLNQKPARLARVGRADWRLSPTAVL